MPKLSLFRGTTSKTVKILIQDVTQVTGTGLTGLVYNSSGLTAYYIREGDASTTAITLATATVGTWTSGGFKEVDSTNMPGLYELGLPNATVSTGNSVTLILRGATNMAQVNLEIQLDAVNYQSTTAFITGVNSLAPPTNWNALAITGGGAVTVGTNSDKTGYSLTQTFPTNFSSLAITGGGAVTAGTVSDKTGYALTSGEHTAVAGDVLNATASSYNTAGTIGNKINSGGSGSVTVGGYAAGKDPATLLLVNPANLLLTNSSGQIQIDQTQAITHGGTSGTIGRILEGTEADGLGKETIVGTAYTRYREDGTTVVRAFTLDNATTPTSRT